LGAGGGFWGKGVVITDARGKHPATNIFSTKPRRKKKKKNSGRARIKKKSKVKGTTQKRKGTSAKNKKKKRRFYKKKSVGEAHIRDRPLFVEARGLGVWVPEVGARGFPRGGGKKKKRNEREGGHTPEIKKKIRFRGCRKATKNTRNKIEENNREEKI